MRALALLTLFGLAACSDSGTSASDLATHDLHVSLDDLALLDLSSPSDASDGSTPPDSTSPPDLACPVQLVGGIDPASQGWTVISVQPAVVTEGADYTQLATSTSGGTSGSGQLLLTKSLVTPGAAFAVEVVAKVVAVSGHNQLDAPVAFMGSLHGQVGDSTDRSEMIYIDGSKIGWADDTQSAAANALDDAFHTYRLSVDAAGNATVSRDGVQVLSRAGFVTNGVIAFGDQTNDPNVDATTQVKSIQLVCP